MIPPQISQAPASKVCTMPEIGRLLPDYIVDLLDDAECESVERHLIDCHRCKEYYLTILRARREARARSGGMIENNQDGVTETCTKAAAVALGSSSVQRKGKA